MEGLPVEVDALPLARKSSTSVADSLSFFVSLVLVRARAVLRRSLLEEE